MNDSGSNFNTMANEEDRAMILNDTDMRYENVMQDRNNQQAKERFIQRCNEHFEKTGTLGGQIGGNPKTAGGTRNIQQF